MYPRSSDDTSVWDRHGKTPAHVQFKYACEGLVLWARRAETNLGCLPLVDWFARDVMQRAKALGLYREPPDVTVRLHVESGEPIPVEK